MRTTRDNAFDNRTLGLSLNRARSHLRTLTCLAYRPERMYCPHDFKRELVKDDKHALLIFRFRLHLVSLAVSVAVNVSAVFQCPFLFLLKVLTYCFRVTRRKHLGKGIWEHTTSVPPVVFYIYPCALWAPTVQFIQHNSVNFTSTSLLTTDKDGTRMRIGIGMSRQTTIVWIHT